MSQSSQPESLAVPRQHLSKISRGAQSARRTVSDASTRSRSLLSAKGRPSRAGQGSSTAHVTVQDYSLATPDESVPVHSSGRDAASTLPAPKSARQANTQSRESIGSGMANQDAHTSYSHHESEAILSGRTTPRIDSDKTTTRMDSDRFSENTIVPRRNLTEIDVAALILNKMVGTGIFTTPGAVLAYTKSKPISIVLWVVGGIYTSLFLLVYIEFGSALPFTGGELIYLDEVFPNPELLATILFSGFFLILGNSYGNAITFAKNIVLAAEPNATKATDLDSRLVRFIAIVILSVVCVFHFSSSRFGLFMNKLIAMFKVILLFAVFAAGVKTAKTEGVGRQEFNTVHGDRNSLDGLAAMVLILYAYQGWENANYVAGEIRRSGEGATPARTLKIGAFLAVLVVSILYVLVTVAYYLVCDFDSIVHSQSDLGVAILFAPKVFGGSMGLKVCIALSAFGNLLAVAFTASKVKQAIAVQRVLPFYKFLQKDIYTAKGALVLHWISSTVLIVICPTSADGYDFAVGLFTYGHVIVGMFVTLGLYRLPNRMRRTWPGWRPEVLTNKFVFNLVPIVFTGGNLIVLYFGAKPRGHGTISRSWWPIIFFLIMAGSFIYWAVMRATEIEVGVVEDKPVTLGQKIGFEVIIHNETGTTYPETMEEAMVQSRLDGSRRRIEYKFGANAQRVGKGFISAGKFLDKYMF